MPLDQGKIEDDMDSKQLPAFEPWVGSRYPTEGITGVRLLILGESQYAGKEWNLIEPVSGGNSPGDRASTKELVQTLGIEGPVIARPFWTKVAKVVLGIHAGESISKLQREDFWSRVAFYNYVQWWMPGARHRPNASMWTEARAPFCRVVHDLSPHSILVLGFQLQMQLPKIQTDLVAIKHPSSVGFSYAMWQDKVREAIVAARRL